MSSRREQRHEGGVYHGHGKGFCDLFTNGVNQEIKDVTSKLGALHHTDECLPRTAGLTDSEQSILRNKHEDGSSRDHEDCPVTGRLSDVLDDYVVFPKILGEGHYGRVRECVHYATQLNYACKSIDKSRVRRLDHLRNEIQLLSELDHEGVMKMVDYYEDADCVHIVSERYTGGELFEMIVGNKNPNGCLTEHRAARIAKSLLEAVPYLHDQDIIHRDIKPENVLFQSKKGETLKLIDFGLSRRHAREEPCIGMPAGTSYYMSPEVLEGEYGKSCDLWSVGVIVYMLLSGVPPFDGETDSEVFHAISQGNLEFSALQWDFKSDGAKKFIGRLLWRDPKKRMTAREALQHPWIRSLGQRRERRQSPKVLNRPKNLKYLRIL